MAKAMKPMKRSSMSSKEGDMPKGSKAEMGDKKMSPMMAELMKMHEKMCAMCSKMS